MSVQPHATGALDGLSFSPKSFILGGKGLVTGRLIGYCMLHLSKQTVRSSSVISLLIMLEPGVKVSPNVLAVVYLLAMAASMSLAMPQHREQSWFRHSFLSTKTRFNAVQYVI